MTDREIVKAALKARRWSQKKLAEETGMHSSANISQALRERGNDMLTSTFYKMLDALDYEIIIRDRSDPSARMMLDYGRSADDEDDQLSSADQIEAEQMLKAQRINELLTVICNNGMSDLIDYLASNQTACQLVRKARDMQIPASDWEQFFSDHMSFSN